jgi:hypothetical protein
MARNYNERMFPEFAEDLDRLRARAALMQVRLDCAVGRHRTETDDETGAEMCRFCGVEVEES